MNHDNSPDVQDQLPACYRCHASKVRCRRAPGQVRCRRCTRAAYPDCHPRPSRRGRIGQQQTRGPRGMSTTPKEAEEDSLPGPASSSNNMAAEATEPGHELHELRHHHDMDADQSHALLDLIGDDLSNLLWTPLVSDFDPDSLQHAGGTLHASLAPTPSQPSACSDDVSPGPSEPLPDCSVTASSACSSRNKARDSGGGSERPSPELSRLSSASYMQALTDLNAQMLSQQDSMSEGIRQFLAAPPTRYSHGGRPPPTATTCELSSRRTSISSSDTASFGPPSDEGPVEAALRLGLALRSLLRPHQTRERDMPTALFLLSTVLRLASLLHDLLARLQGMVAAQGGTNRNAQLCAFVFPPVRLGSLLLDERDDDRLRPLQMHSIAMALSTAEGLIDEVIQLTERSLPDHVNDASSGGAGDDGEGGNAKDEFGLQALTRALVAKQEAVVESISRLRGMLGC